MRRQRNERDAVYEIQRCQEHELVGFLRFDALQPVDRLNLHKCEKILFRVGCDVLLKCAIARSPGSIVTELNPGDEHAHTTLLD